MTTLLSSSLGSEVFPGTTAQGCKFSVHLSSLLLVQPDTRKPSGTRSLKAVLLYTFLYRHLALSLLLPHTLIWNLRVNIYTHSEKAEVCILFFFSTQKCTAPSLTVTLPSAYYLFCTHILPSVHC